ncbi:MAG: hypothetical protein KC733_09875, partial [Candidatus Omnitrophica bacterium]|nr:hypothetical protein [Candidatus Omnitrophota bacterium]
MLNINTIIRKIYQNRELIAAFTIRNIELKYKQTFLGILWALFMPGVIILSGAIVRIAMAYMMGKTFEFQQVFSVCVKSIPWTFFIASLKFAVSSLVSNMHILQKTNCSRVIFPVSYVISQFFDFLVASAVFVLIAVFFQSPVSWNIVWLIPITAILFCFTLGWSILLSAANLFYRDVRHIVDVVLMFGVFFTLVFFEVDLFGRGRLFLMLNPMG